jgi:hypothetical protein
MITGAMAREQIADRVREADAFRRSRTTRRGSDAARRAAGRKVASGVMAVLAAPFRH